MSDKAVLVDFGLAVQMTEDIYIPRDLRGTEVRNEMAATSLLKLTPVKASLPLMWRVCAY